MSGIETVKAIVDAEKEAARIVEDATTRAAAIRKKIGSSIQEQRQQMLAEAKKNASTIAERAKEEGRIEADRYEKEYEQNLRELVAKASAKKAATVEKLMAIITQVDK